MNSKFLFILLNLAFSTTIFAQSEKENRIEEFTVTANKFVQKLNETGKTVTIISDSTLRQSEGMTLSQILNMQAGITITGANGNFGTLQIVFTRGASAGNTLILWNGMPLSDPSNIDAGMLDLNLIPIEQIGRIEIVKSSQSTLYGSDAMAGVINIITREAKGKKFSPFVNLALGSYRTGRANGGLLLNTEKIQGGLLVGFQKTDGFSDATDPDSLQRQNFDKDGSVAINTMGFLSFKINDKLKARGFFNSNGYKGNADYDANIDEKDYTITNVFSSSGVGLDYIYDKGKAVFNLKMDGFSRNYLNDSLEYNADFGKEFSKSGYTGNNIFTELYVNHRFNSNIGIVLGADYRSFNSSSTYSYISPFSAFTSKSPKNAAPINIASAYSILYLKLGGLNVELGGRINQHSIYGTNTTFSFNPSYAFNPKIRLFANASSGFRAPSMYQMYTNSILRDSINLKPEENISTELGLNFTATDNTNIRVVAFSRQAKNLLFYVGNTNKYINIEKQNDKGFELEADFHEGKFGFNANYTFLTGEITKKLTSVKDTIFNNLFRRPANSLNFVLTYELNKKCLFRANTRIVGKRKDLFYSYATYENKVTTLKPYAVLDLYAEYKFNSIYKVFLQLGNVTDTQYTDVYGYNTRRMNAMFGVSMKW
jgi:vitamin B12 transporter